MRKVKKAPARPRAKRKTKKTDSSLWALAADFCSRFAVAGAAGATVIAAIAAAGLWAGGYFGLAGDRLSRIAGAGAVAAGFEVRRITGKGNEQANNQDLLDAIGPVIGTSMLHFDIDAARARVEALGWVRSAAVSRLWPETVHVSIREREPAAVWQISGVLHLIDPDGAIIREIDAFEYSNLPLIVGAGAPESASGALKALRADSELWSRTAALIRVGDRRWDVRLKAGGDVRFPETGYGEAISILAEINEAYGLLDRGIEYIDLRDPNQIVFREVDAPERQLSVDPPAR
jgi:cell division protein FtsQ